MGTRDLTETEKKHGILYKGEPYTLRIDLNTLMPSEDTSNPSANKAAQLIADEFMAMFPNVTIEWDRTKGDDWSYWMTTQLAAESAPDICFLQGSQYGDRGWFIPLNSYLDEANVFVPDNMIWKNMFPNYVWENYLCSDAAGNIVAVPLTLYPGTATAYYYNKDIFEELNLEVPTEWKDFVDICKKINEAGYVALAPWKDNKKVQTGLWDIQFSLGPTFSYALKDVWDLDGSGSMSQHELLRAAYNGVFDLTADSGGMVMYDLVKEKYTEILQVGAGGTDYEPLWNQGKVAMIEDGLWRLPAENANTEREFEYGMFPVPVATTATTSKAADVEYKKGAYNPPVHESYQIVKKTVESKGEGAIEVCIRFLHWLTSPDNVNLLIEEGKGGFIGAVKGTMVPSLLDEWLQNDFARLPTSQWVMWPTSDSFMRMSKYLEMYVRDMISQEEFIVGYNKELETGTQSQANGLGLDTTGW
ncbi:MAG: extracellular solute-binding protein [Prolixibacteraceae bacterium]|nr:extracellular solute-binding protein [Prolixibacteraceae bacterium]